MMDKWEYMGPGIPDDLFVRGRVPMTKEEVRVLTVSKLKLRPDSTVLDIGAGTGSLTVECACQASKGRVIAVEKNPAALNLIRENAARFELSNVEIIEGEAPSCLAGLPLCDAVFIGGSSGNIKEIIKEAKKLLKTGGRLVINAILIETVYAALCYLKEENMKGTDILSVSLARGRDLGGMTAFEPLNPVYIIWGEKP